MKLRTIAGFGIGYFLGARSQAEGTEDPQELLKSLTHSDAFKTVMHQARQLAASGMEALTGQEPSWAPESENGSSTSDASSGGDEESSSEGSSSDSSSGGSS